MSATASTGAMSSLGKMRLTPLDQVLSRAELSPEATAFAGRCPDAAAAFAALRQAGAAEEAARFAAFALPRREAVWWACMCCRAIPPAPSGDDLKAREQAEIWVYRQTDAARREAFSAAQAAGYRSAEAWAGVAAFWSGGSIAPADRPTAAPGPGLAGKAVFSAVSMAALRGRPGRKNARLAWFLDSAADIASGGAGRMEQERG